MVLAALLLEPITSPTCVCQRKSALSERLDETGLWLVEELWAQAAIAQCEENESRFKYGFSAGLNPQEHREILGENFLKRYLPQFQRPHIEVIFLR